MQQVSPALRSVSRLAMGAYTHDFLAEGGGSRMKYHNLVDPLHLNFPHRGFLHMCIAPIISAMSSRKSLSSSGAYASQASSCDASVFGHCRSSLTVRKLAPEAAASKADVPKLSLTFTSIWGLLSSIRTMWCPLYSFAVIIRAVLPVIVFSLFTCMRGWSRSCRTMSL